MTAVSDTSPLNYLVLIGEEKILPVFFDRVLIPGAVQGELRADNAPDIVRSWISKPPGWLIIDLSGATIDRSSHLHPGECEAIGLALAIKPDALIMDEARGREEARARQLPLIGTLRLLRMAHDRGLLGFETALAKLRNTSFRASDKVIRQARSQ